MRCRGQALIEVALCTPIIMVLALGTVAAVRLADARSGLDAATASAAASAARAPDRVGAEAAARQRFAAVIAGYPVEGAGVEIDVGGFARGGEVRVTGRGTADLTFALLPGGAARVSLTSRATAQAELWRSR
jgi:Flp pilus assembly protein TadG